MLCTEVERMSALWENLDRQLKSKIFDLSAMEEKLGKAMTEVRALYEISVFLIFFFRRNPKPTTNSSREDRSLCSSNCGERADP